MERTLSIIKPDITKRNLTGEVNAMIEKAGFKIVAQKRIHMTPEIAGKFYEEHHARPFFKDLCAIMSSAPVIVQVLKKDNAIEDHRNLMGDTNPKNAKPGTIREKYGVSLDENSVHGSDSHKSAAREIAFFFSTLEIVG